jgi:hypothetical protein
MTLYRFKLPNSKSSSRSTKANKHSEQHTFFKKGKKTGFHPTAVIKHRKEEVSGCLK